MDVVWLLVGDWSIVGGVGSDDSRGVHHVLTSQVGLTYFSQAEWRERGWELPQIHDIPDDRKDTTVYVSVSNLIFDSIKRSSRTNKT